MVFKKSIFILSSDYDQSTSDVLDWILLNTSDIIRFDYTKGLNVEDVEINKKETTITFKYNGNIYSTENIRSFWFRKGVVTNTKIELSDSIHSGIKWYLKEESKSVNDFLSNELDKKAVINQIKTGDINKLLQLSTAVSCGLDIPNTLLTKNTESVKKFITSNEKVISKSIQVPFGIVDKNASHTLYTSTFELEDIGEEQDTFFITKFQSQIDKQYELRIFFLKNKLYPMAIFSQRNAKTKTDFRNYDTLKPNRRVPYELPLSVENKLKKFIKKMCLTSGSIDLIVDVNNKFYFLEVNPVGQFNMVSDPCNYYIEEEIANLLYDY